MNIDSLLAFLRALLYLIQNDKLDVLGEIVVVMIESIEKGQRPYHR